MVSMWDHWGKTQSKCVRDMFGRAESDWIMLGLEYQIGPNECVRWTIEFESRVQRKCRSEWRRGQARPRHIDGVRENTPRGSQRYLEKGRRQSRNSDLLDIRPKRIVKKISSIPDKSGIVGTKILFWNV